MKALVTTVGTRKESLGAMKNAAWLRRVGWDVTEANAIDRCDWDYDLYCFSAVFSWRLPDLVKMVRVAQLSQGEIWIGGPAVTFHAANAKFVEGETGITPTTGLDPRFEGETGNFPMVYFSRGCPAYTPACGQCPVPRLEGNTFTFYPDAQPAPLLLDNNLSALPVDYQDYIIRKYETDWRGGLVDANSGFEPHTFTEQTLLRWQHFPLLNALIQSFLIAAFIFVLLLWRLPFADPLVALPTQLLSQSNTLIEHLIQHRGQRTERSTTVLIPLPLLLHTR